MHHLVEIVELSVFIEVSGMGDSICCEICRVCLFSTSVRRLLYVITGLQRWRKGPAIVRWGIKPPICVLHRSDVQFEDTVSNYQCHYKLDGAPCPPASASYSILLYIEALLPCVGSEGKGQISDEE